MYPQANLNEEPFSVGAPNTMLALSAGLMDNDLDSDNRSIPSVEIPLGVLPSCPERLKINSKCRVGLD